MQRRAHLSKKSNSWKDSWYLNSYMWLTIVIIWFNDVQIKEIKLNLMMYK